MIYSISVLVHNRPRIVEKCLESIVESVDQDYEIGELELIVTDNGSNERTRDVLEKIHFSAPRGLVALVRNPTNRGVIQPKNEALMRARGEFFVSLDSDCLVSDGWLERLRKPFLQDSKVGQTGRRAGFRTLTGSGIGVRGGRTDYVDGSCFMVPTWLARELGLCDEAYEFAYCEDSDFSLRLRKAGWKIELVPAGVRHREHATASKMDLGKVWKRNHRIFLNRWRGYLQTRAFGHPGEP